MQLAAVPPAAADLFGDRLPLAMRYADWLVGEGARRGLVGPRETDRIWPRHLMNCAVLGALIGADAHVVDIGSGSGLPGLALAIARPDLRIVLVESMQRRAAFLTEVVTDLGLAGNRGVTVRRVRAEELAEDRLSADVVTARAVASIERLCRWSGPLLAPRGCLLAIKGAGLVEELTTGWRSIQSAGFNGDVDLLELSVCGARESSKGRATWRNVAVTSLARWSGGKPPEAGLAMPLGAGDDERAALVLRLARSPQGSPDVRS